MKKIFLFLFFSFCHQASFAIVFFGDSDSTISESFEKFQVPVAIAGENLISYSGATIILNGSKSYDLVNYPLNFEWKILQSPDESLNYLSNEFSEKATLLTDKSGIYLIGLRVFNSQISSELDTLLVEVIESPLKTQSTSDFKSIESIVYPNPATDHVNIDFEVGNETHAEYFIYDKNGNIQAADFIELVPNAANTHKILLNGIENRPDVYILKLSFGDKYLQKKIMIK